MPPTKTKRAPSGPSLVIVESPAKAKTIQRFLGDDFVVEASFGHVRDLPESADDIPEEIKKEKWARLGVNTDADFEPHYVIPASKAKQVANLRKSLRGAARLLLATDEDREGESISWHLLQLLDPRVPVERIVFHEITPEAIREALDNPRQVDERLVRAQETRRILDRLYGYSLSPVLWRKVQSGLSAGRVQSVAVRLVVEREEERRAFVSSEYWDLEAKLGSPSGEFKATLTRVGERRIATGKDFDSSTGRLKSTTALLLDAAKAKALLDEVMAAPAWTVASVDEKPASQSPAPPFTTSTLQQEANRKLGFSADRTMKAAQRLYEGVDMGGERVGLITYMRTDSFTLSERALNEAQAEIKRLYGGDYTNGPRRYRTKSRNAQEAHEAIRPTNMSRRPQDVAAFLDGDDARIYELIWKRTIASQMTDARLLRTSVEIAAPTQRGEAATFAASGKRILFPGYLRAYVEGSDDPAADLGDQEFILPTMTAGQKVPTGRATAADTVRVVGCEPKKHTTEPPARYTEAALIKKLEEEGVGRPSTYATIISTIQARGYVFKQGKGALVPTFTAMAVTNLLRRHFGDYVDVGFTAKLEEELDEIAEGRIDWLDHLRAFYRGKGGASQAADGKHPGLETLIARENDKIDFPVVDLGIDPESKEPVSVRIGRYGPFVARGKGGEGNVASIPEGVMPADFSVEQALDLIKARNTGPRSLGNDPATGLPVYVARGRFGPYVQLGDVPEDSKEKPKRASLAQGMSEDSVTLGEALKLLSLPRELGRHPDDGEAVIANIGRFGPYVQHGKEFRSLKAGDDPYTVGFERALELLAAPKTFGRGGGARAAKTVLKDLGKTGDGRAIQVLDGRYGAYISDGTTNANVPKGTTPEALTIDQALELLAERAKSGGKKPFAKKAAAKKAAAPKAAVKSAKKAARGKSAA